MIHFEPTFFTGAAMMTSWGLELIAILTKSSGFWID